MVLYLRLDLLSATAAVRSVTCDPHGTIPPHRVKVGSPLRK